MGIHPAIEVSVLGMWDTMLLMVLALVVFGPRRLPKIGRQIGKLMYEFRKASNDFKFQMEEELRNAEEADRRKREEEERQRALAAATPAQIAAVAMTPEAAEAAAAVDGVLGPADGPDTPSSYDEAEAAAAPVESEHEEMGLRVHPPETGAPVPAERPTSRAVRAQAEAVDEAANEPVTGETGLDSSHDISESASGETEPARHHG
jgi:sec-independent protein translocase protein TatB